MWAAGKITKKIVGEDVANQIEAENLAKTPEGQTELLQTALNSAKKGEPMTAEAQNALKKAIEFEQQKALQQQTLQQQQVYPQQTMYPQQAGYPQISYMA